jgi:hypothetical protein
MKNDFRLILCITLIVWANAFYGQTLTVLTYDFETADASWTYNMTTGVSIGRANNNANTGSWSGAHIGGVGTNNRIDGSIITPLITFQKGFQYSINVYAKTNSQGVSNPPVFKIALASTATNAAMKAASGANLLLNTTLTSASYSLFSASYTPSADVNLYVGFHSQSGANNVSSWIDDVVITRTCILTNPNAGSDLALCNNPSGTLNANNPEYGNGSWNIISGTITIADPNQHNSAYSGLGNGTVLLEWVISLSGCNSKRDTLEIRHFYSAPPQPDPINGVSSVCPPVTGAVFYISPTPLAETYSWSTSTPGTLTFTSSTNDTIVTVDLATTSNSTYTLQVEAVNTCGPSIKRGHLIRRAVSTPSPISGPTVACANAVESYSINSVAGAESYTWSGPAGSLINGMPAPQTLTATSVNITFPAGFTSGTVSVSSNVACFTSPPRVLNVKNTPDMPGVISGVNKICPGSSYTYSITSVAGAVSYNWTVPAGVNITNPSSPPYGTSIEAAFPSNYNLTGPASNLCVSAVSACSTVSPARCRSVVSTVPTVTSAISASPSATGLCNSTAVFTVQANAYADQYVWSYPSGAVPTSPTNLNSISLQFPSNFTTGTIQVYALNNTCSVGSNVRTLSVSGIPAVPGPITSTPPVICFFNPASFSIAAVYGATNYVWTVTGTNNQITGQSNTPPNPFIDVLWGPGNGVVQVRSQNSCGTSAIRALAVYPSCSRLLMETQQQPSGATLMPNPASGYTSLVFPSPVETVFSLTIYDLTGKTVLPTEYFRAKEGLNQAELYFSLARGLYVVELRSEHTLERIKMIVE